MHQGKKALVTGASRGIGKAIAIELAKNGCEVLLHYVESSEAVNKVAKQIEANGGKAIPVCADLRDTKQAIQLAEQSWDLLGRVDYLVNNAGISYKKHFLDVTEEDFDLFTNVHFKSTTFLTQTIARKMVISNVKGSIYSITSVNALTPGIGLSTYGATKGAIETMMRGVALELAPHGINVNTIVVGAIQTDMTASVWENPGLLNMVNEGIPSGRLGQPEEIAKVISGLLASGSYLTGSSLTIDGGLLLMRGYGKPTLYKQGEDKP